jgi:superfamily II DNA/RNA helicase
VKFSELNLHPKVMAGVTANGFEDCTEIQTVAIPHLLEGKDVAGLAQTGTGKTAAFLLPLLDRVMRSKEPVGDAADVRAFKEFKKSNFVLVLVPTRELAEQVYTNFKSLSGSTGLKAVSVYGGTSYEPQTKAFKEGVDFVIATPGRLIDLFKEHVVDLGQVRAVVFDEADRMFDMGFKDDMKYILQRVPRDRHFLVFSATLNFEVLEVAYEFGSHPVEVNVSRDQAKAENVTDEIFHVGQFDKAKYLLALFQKLQPKQAIVFSNFRFNVDRVAQFLSQNGFPAMGISSLLTQSQRLRVMNLFRAENDKNILVATDLAARGLDIKGVDLVINFELPDDPENYVHRIGRTGRAGATGKAFSLVSERDVEALQRIEGFLEHKVPIGWLEDSDLPTDFKPFQSDRERRPFDKGGSGPRRDGPRRDGPRRDGPRRDGPRRDGPPRREGGPRRDGPRYDGPRRDFNGPAKDGPRRDGPRKDGPRRDGARREDSRHAQGSRGAEGQRRPAPKPYKHRPQTGGRPTPGPMAAQVGLKQKISGFLKKLFG